MHLPWWIMFNYCSFYHSCGESIITDWLCKRKSKLLSFNYIIDFLNFCQNLSLSIYTICECCVSCLELVASMQFEDDRKLFLQYIFFISMHEIILKRFVPSIVNLCLLFDVGLPYLVCLHALKTRRVLAQFLKEDSWVACWILPSKNCWFSL